MKINKKIQLIILILVILVAGYFAFNEFYLKKSPENNYEKMVKKQEELFEFNNYDESLSVEKVNAYFEEFNKTRDFIIANPQALNPTSWVTLARIKKYIKDYKGAEDIYLALLLKNPENYMIHGNLADLYLNYLYD
jgi:hypothetical protein